MAYIQKKFEQYYESIRTGYDYHTALREKRDTLLDNLNDNLTNHFRYFNQGSYGMSTGVKPLNGDYDIDVGLVFEEGYHDQFSDVISLKKSVESALKHQNRTIKIKRPCVTVQYSKNGDSTYHVDFAIYKKQFLTENLYFARGKPGDDETQIAWEPAEPESLIDKIKNKYSNPNDRNQYRRCIRYLKRWKNIQIAHKNVPSIALTVAAYNEFSPTYFDDDCEQPDDVSALINFLTKFKSTISSQSIVLPVKNYNSLLGNLTEKQSTQVIKKISKLIKDLEKAQDDNTSESKACSLMRKHFGSDFPEGQSEYSVKNSEQFIERMFAIDSDLKEVDIDVEIQDGNNTLQKFWDEYTKIPHYRNIIFTVQNRQSFPSNAKCLWKVRNVGRYAEEKNCLRGQIVEGTYQRSEPAKFGGDHYVECYIVVDQLCIARGSVDVPIED